MRSIFRNTPEIPHLVRVKLLARDPNSRRWPSQALTRRVEPYPRELVEALRSAARTVVKAAHDRITANYRLVQCAGGDKAERKRAVALKEILELGRPQSADSALALNCVDQGRNQSSAMASATLFITPAEALASAVLMACQRGLNLSAIMTTSTPVHHEPGVLQLQVDKPRRGSIARFWPEIITDRSDLGQAAATAVTWIEEATDPAREHLARSGNPTDRLLIYSNGSDIKFGIPRKEPSAPAFARYWLPDGFTSIDFQRLRRSSAEGVRKEPTHHSDETALYYARTDEARIADHQQKASASVMAAMLRAREEVARQLSDQDTDPHLDAVVATCADPDHHPNTNESCDRGLYGFLDCLDCENAGDVPRLLPRQIATLNVLESLRASLEPERWERRFFRRWCQLTAMIERRTQEERDRASPVAPQFEPLIIAALEHKEPPT